MAVVYADRVFVEIDGTVVPCKEATYNATQDQERVKPMNRANRPTGYVSGIPDFELSLVVPEPKAGHDVNFNQLFLDQTLFTTKFFYNDGTARTFRDCQIQEVDQSGSEGEGIDTSLTIQALDMELN